jgi:hypothetical protein
LTWFSVKYLLLGNCETADRVRNGKEDTSQKVPGLVSGRSRLDGSPAASRLGQQFFMLMWIQAFFLNEVVVVEG